MEQTSIGDRLLVKFLMPSRLIEGKTVRFGILLKNLNKTNIPGGKIKKIDWQFGKYNDQSITLEENIHFPELKPGQDFKYSFQDEVLLGAGATFLSCSFSCDGDSCYEYQTIGENKIIIIDRDRPNYFSEKIEIISKKEWWNNKKWWFQTIVMILTLLVSCFGLYLAF